MPKKIIKRNGDQVKFDPAKIRAAIFKANVRIATERFSDKDLDDLTAQVVGELESMESTPTVEQTQDIVEEKLIAADYAKTAKAYILYRAQHQRLREMDDELVKIYSALTFVPAEDVDLKRENANINADTAMGTMLKYGSEGAKSFYDKYVIPAHLAKADADGDIHIHDKDFYTLTETCCQIDLIKLFKNGFSTGHGYLREPKDIRSYAALACIAIQANQNEMHGGQSVPNFDYSMARGVDKTYHKEYLKALIQFFQLRRLMPHGQAEAMINRAAMELHNKVTMKNADKYGKAFVDYLPQHQKECGFEQITWEEAADAAAYAKETAWRETDKATYQAMEALVHNLNTMNSRAGAQVPFSSINYGTDTSEQGRMVVRNLLLATEAGLGDGETPIFPVQIFKVKEGINYNPEDPNYDLFKLAMRVSAKRLFPNFSFIDAPFNLQYYKKGDYDTEIAYMGCRTRVMGNVHDRKRETTCGRGNLSFTSVNLPRTGIEAKGDIKKFYELLDERIDLCVEQLLHRFKIQSSKKAYNYPFLMGQGVWIDSDSLDRNDSVAEVLKHGTLSVGFIGLAETLVALTGKHHGESEESYKLGLEIITYMRERMDKLSEKYGLNFTLLATPAEGLSGTFTRSDKKKYGIIKGVTDRDYYTNSFHVPVYYPISAFEKIKKEAPFHALTNAGHISYVELDGDVAKNLDAFESIIRCMKESGIGYGSVNHPVDRDPVCGYNGIINEFCPRCGRRSGEGVPLEKLDELRKKYHDVPDYSGLIS
ncbi:MAG: anaerobic ribonucleoside triphosphate reductase [Acutalibacter sp.]|jgi:anaerobic ribonucleoside-triphosphate reductase|uniref:anaerobic ribonucleoside triphosphate reductase n=1 Tax=Acutalibacter sp. TaxID=1918636 RepID=UPI002171188D|nr:anaerobic ribonucleoside triphosphate reductase [Acutalibacter sp.]MCI9224452.1 anaerobic ribonucleoside triphosphate reductase [Acutalibacter sp.]